MTFLPSVPRARKAVLAALVCAGLALSATACAEEKPDPDKGTNGVGKLTAAEIETKARTTAGAAKAVRVSGTLVSKGGTFKLDMRLKDGGGTGSVTSQQETFELLRIDDALYLKADASFWVHQDEGGGEQAAAGPSDADRQAAGKLGGKYVKVPQGDPAYKEFRGFTDKAVLLDGLLGMEGELSKGERTRVGGVRTIKVQAAEGAGGVLDVALDGLPYPVRFARAAGKGVLSLAEWDKDFALAAPPQEATVDYGGQLPKSTD